MLTARILLSNKDDSSPAEKQNQKVITNPQSCYLDFISGDQFAKITNSMPMEDVKQIIGHIGGHEFTINVENENCQLTRFWLSEGSGMLAYVLFKNDEVNKMFFSRDLWNYTKNLPRASSSSNLYHSNDRMVEAVMKLPGRSAESVSRRLSTVRERSSARRESTQSQIPPQIASELVKRMSPKIADDWRRNRELADKYDGNKIDLGNTLHEVESLYGSALAQNADGKSHIRIYGASEKLAVQNLYKYSFVAVVYESDMVRQVYSNTFFKREWELLVTEEIAGDQ